MSKKPAKNPIPQAGPVRQPAAASASKSSGNNGNKSSSAAKPPFSLMQLYLILAGICFALYANTLFNGYVLDDVMVLKDNTMVQKGFGGITELLATPHMRGYLIIPNDLYRPLSLVMFAIEYQFFGATPFVGHLFNIITFAGCVIMLFQFLDKFFNGNKTALAFVAALIFAVHPIHTEVVANIKSRDELMCFFFGFLSLNIFYNYIRDGKMMQLVLGVFIFFLALISKETVIAFAGIIPLLFFFYKTDNRSRSAQITGGVILAIAIFMGIRSYVLNLYNANQPAPVEFIDNALAGSARYTVSFVQKFTTEWVIMGKYLRLMFIPYPLLCNYSFNAIPFADMADYRFWLSFLANIYLVYVAVTRFLKDSKDPWAFAIIFYFATLFLFSNFPFLMGAALAERFAFFCSMGVCLAGALAIEKFVVKGELSDIAMVKSSKVLMVLAPLCLIFGGMTFARNSDWKDNYTLYKVDVEKSPDDCRLHHYVATSITEEMYPKEKDTLAKKQMDNESINELKKSLVIYPDYAEAYIELGRIYDRSHRWDSAEYYDKVAVTINPGNFTANNNMGNVYLSTGKYPQAIVFFKKAIELNPNFKYAYYNLGLSYKQLNMSDSSIYFFKMMLTFEPGYVNAIQEIGMGFFQKAAYDSAEKYFRIVMQAMPQDANAVNNVGSVYLNMKKYPQAIEQFKKAITLNAGYMSSYSNLGRAYYFSGQYNEALATFLKEVQLDPKTARDIPFIALTYQKLGNMPMALQYEAAAKRLYSDFKLEK